jgi:hypothetical protein
MSAQIFLEFALANGWSRVFDFESHWAKGKNVEKKIKQRKTHNEIPKDKMEESTKESFYCIIQYLYYRLSV